MTVKELAARLKTYPGANKNEDWKLEADLNKCTAHEKAELAGYDITPADLMVLGMNRGEVHHILYGYKHTKA